MDEDKSLQVAASLEEMAGILKNFIEFTKDLVEQFSETGLLTVETKKDFDNIVFESENSIKEAEALLDSKELPM